MRHLRGGMSGRRDFHETDTCGDCRAAGGFGAMHGVRRLRERLSA
jgi:hypothetical protein